MSGRGSLYMVQISPLSDLCSETTFSWSGVCLFVFLQDVIFYEHLTFRCCTVDQRFYAWLVFSVSCRVSSARSGLPRGLRLQNRSLVILDGGHLFGAPFLALTGSRSGRPVSSCYDAAVSLHLTWLGAPSGGRGLPGCSLRRRLPLPRGPPISVCALLGADPQGARRGRRLRRESP